MDRETIRTYNLIVEEYDEETADFWFRFPNSFIKKFKGDVSGTVLDIGSGPGRDAILLQSAGLNVICLDSSEAMVKKTIQKGLSSALGDFNNIPFPDHTFDGIWAYTSLIHVPKFQFSQAIQEIKRVLKNNGILGLGVIEGDTEGYNYSAGINLPRYFSFYKKEEIELGLRNYGLEIFYFEQFKPKTRNYLNFLARNRF